MQTTTKYVAKPAGFEFVPRTQDSIPLGAADRLIVPLDLDALGYSEAEYLISGESNVYEWPKEERYPYIRVSGAPYTSRILVRKPAKAKFSGIVIVELYNWAADYDRSRGGFGYSWEYYTSRGHGWVGLSCRDFSTDALKKYDPVRYAKVGFPNPLPKEERGEPFQNYHHMTNPENENGLIWDMISQVAALVKSDMPGQPFKDYKVDKVMLTGATGGDLSAYVSAVHPITKLENGSTPYDGFLIYMTGSPGGINQRCVAIGELDERSKFYSEVPLIHVYTTGDMLDKPPHPAWQYMQRRPDADELGKKLRLYEVSGAAPGAKFASLRGDICKEDAVKVNDVFKDIVLPLPHEFPIGYVLSATCEQLIKWMKFGIAPESVPYLEIEGVYPHSKLAEDEFGNAKGGLRSPYVDVPAYMYDQSSVAHRLPDEVLKKLYSSHEDYVEKVVASTIAMLQKGHLLPEDAQKVIMEAVTSDIP